jgi:hypothetical protein
MTNMNQELMLMLMLMLMLVIVIESYDTPAATEERSMVDRSLVE